MQSLYSRIASAEPLSTTLFSNFAEDFSTPIRPILFLRRLEIRIYVIFTMSARYLTERL